ncbi:hypothetical protein CWI38_0420p0020 [Hamiltosporidium tvaerminnensis]|uniref:Protein SDA1 n=3 Tax=Hamiltosporidium TaxID=1176354 RepID=A0A4Q9M0C4_9MICR|nr:hypothetical protein CWI38_0420p0020 [Hamiltosporidium tvaerminnensis]
MDLVSLQSKIFKDPNNYLEEYTEQLEKYKAFVELPIVPLKTLSTLLSFLTTVSHFYPSQYSSLIINHLSVTTNKLLKKEIFTNILILKRKKLITEEDFFTSIFLHTSDFKSVLRMCVKEISDRKTVEIFIKYVNHGNEKQYFFALFCILYCYEIKKYEELEKIICDNLFDKKGENMCLLYFLNLIDFSFSDNIYEKENQNTEKENENVENTENNSKILIKIGEIKAEEICKLLYKDLRLNKMMRDIRVKKLRVISVLKKFYNLKLKIFDYVVKIVDPSKEDLGQLMTVLIECLTPDEAKKGVDMVLDKFCNLAKDDDMVVYGLNILKEISVRFDLDVISYLEDYKKSKSKAVGYAYKMLVKSYNEKKVVGNRSLLYVRKKASEANKENKKDSTEKKNKYKNFKKGNKRRKNNKLK